VLWPISTRTFATSPRSSAGPQLLSGAALEFRARRGRKSYQTPGHDGRGRLPYLERPPSLCLIVPEGAALAPKGLSRFWLRRCTLPSVIVELYVSEKGRYYERCKTARRLSRRLGSAR